MMYYIDNEICSMNVLITIYNQYDYDYITIVYVV